MCVDETAEITGDHEIKNGELLYYTTTNQNDVPYNGVYTDKHDEHNRIWPCVVCTMI